MISGFQDKLARDRNRINRILDFRIKFDRGYGGK